METLEDWYSMSHAWGQLKCWDELFGNNKEISCAIAELKKGLVNINKLSEKLPNIFEWDKFIDFCDNFDPYPG